MSEDKRKGGPSKDQLKKWEREQRKRLQGAERRAATSPPPPTSPRDEGIGPKVAIIVEEARKRGVEPSEEEMLLWQGYYTRPVPDIGPYDETTNVRARQLADVYLARQRRSNNLIAATYANELVRRAKETSSGYPLLEFDFRSEMFLGGSGVMGFSPTVRVSGDFAGVFIFSSPLFVNLSGVENTAFQVHEIDHMLEFMEFIEDKRDLPRDEKNGLLTAHYVDGGYDRALLHEANAYSATAEFLIHQYGLGFRGPMLDELLDPTIKYIHAGASRSSDQWMHVMRTEILTPEFYNSLPKPTDIYEGGVYKPS